MRILIVRMGALGDIVHTIPAASALRRAYPDASLDWVVDGGYLPFVSLVQSVNRVIPLEGRSLRSWLDLVRRLRRDAYDIALDFQGLMKSAVLARASGARRVVGFSIWHLREKGARPFYSDVADPEPEHILQHNLRLLTTLGIRSTEVEFPITGAVSAAFDAVRAQTRGAPFALINPGAAWPNKRWPAERFGEVAQWLRTARGIRPYVLWAPHELELAQSVAAASAGAACLAPPTSIVDLIELSRAAALVVSGDTGPLHIAAAVGAPIVAILGPTSPGRNGPWSPSDVVVSRYDTCRCHYQRRCRSRAWCLDDVRPDEVSAAIERRLGGNGGASSGRGVS